MTERPRPSDVDYEYYREQIELSAEAIVDEYNDDDGLDLHERVWESADSSHFVTHYGYECAAIQLSDQNPDKPDYCEPWDIYYDHESKSSYRDATQAMAYVCVYSDIYDKVQRLLEENDD